MVKTSILHIEDRGSIPLILIVNNFVLVKVLFTFSVSKRNSNEL